ncbi:hypothetical protein KCU88_g466, partial [Aureobasidium melanogenum]
MPVLATGISLFLSAVVRDNHAPTAELDSDGVRVNKSRVKSRRESSHHPLAQGNSRGGTLNSQFNLVLVQAC